MYLDRLRLERFRAIALADLELGPGAHVLRGANAQGKTSLLEAIYYLVTGRSFRSRQDRDVLAWGADANLPTLVEATLHRGALTGDIRFVLTADTKTVLLDGKVLDRLARLWGRLNAVLFTPADLALVQGEPSRRRKFLDAEMSQVRPAHLAHLQRYEHALKQRNAILRQAAREQRNASQTMDLLAAYEPDLAEAGAALIAGRRDWTARLEIHAAQAYRAIAGDYAETMTLRYESSTHAPAATDEIAASLRDAWMLSLDRDLRTSGTNLGPHRDDLVVELDGHDAREFGSQGQQRTIVLALRLAEIAIMRDACGEPPLLLCDDVVGELDGQRRAAFFSALPGDAQVFLTVTDADALPGWTGGVHRWSVSGGSFARAR